MHECFTCSAIFVLMKVNGLSVSAVVDSVTQVSILSKEFVTSWGVSVPTGGIQATPPNCTAGLVCWRILLSQSHCPPSSSKERFAQKVSGRGVGAFGGTRLRDEFPLRVVDSHVHFDLLIKRMGC